MNITEFREKYPDYSDVPDSVLAKKLQEKYYSDIPFDKFAGKFLVQRNTDFEKPTIERAEQIEGGQADIQANPWVDPTAVGAGGITRGALTKGVGLAGKAAAGALGTLTGTIAEPIVGQVGEAVAEKYPEASLPLGVALGVLGAKAIEAPLQKMALKAVPKIIPKVTPEVDVPKVEPEVPKVEPVKTQEPIPTEKRATTRPILDEIPVDTLKQMKQQNVEMWADKPPKDVMEELFRVRVMKQLDTAIGKGETQIEPTVSPKEKLLYEQKGLKPEDIAEADKIMKRTGEEGAITIPSAPEIKTAATRFKEKMIGFWKPLASLPNKELYENARYKSMGDIHRAEGIVNKVWERTKKLDEPTQKAMFQFLDGQIPITALPKETRPFAQTLQTTNNLIGKSLVRRGMLSAETFTEHKGQYIRYSYLKHVLGDKFHTGTSGQMDLSYLKNRKDLTIEQKRAIGLIENVSVAEPLSISKPMQDIAKHDFFAKVAENPDWTWQPSRVAVEGRKMSMGELTDELDIQKKIVQQAKTPETEARLKTLEDAMGQAQEGTKNLPENFIQLPTDKHYGPLAGQFVHKSIANDIRPVWSGMKDTGKVSQLLNSAIRAEEKAMGAFKVGKVALNIPTMARNTVSNYVQLNMSGIPFHEIPGYMTKAGKAMIGKSPDYVIAKRNGLFKTNWAEGEISEVLKTVKEFEGKGYPDVFGGLGKIAKYYGKIDDFFKLTKFIEQRNNGADVGTAIREAQKWGMDYSLAHPAVKVARRHIMPFVSYQYKIAPLIAESLAKRPWVIGKYVAAVPLITEAARKVMNFNDEDWQKLKRQLPLYIKENENMAALPWKSPEGKVQWVNLEYFFPWQNALKIARDTKKGAYGELAGDVGIGNPLMDVYTMAKTMQGAAPPKDPFTGRAIYNQLDDPNEKAWKTANWLYEKWAPSMLTSYGTLGKVSRIGEKDKAGRTITPGQAAGSLVGLNIVAPTPQQTIREKQARMAELRGSLAQIIKDPTLSPEKKRKAMANMRDELKKLRGQ